MKQENSPEVDFNQFYQDSKVGSLNLELGSYVSQSFDNNNNNNITDDKNNMHDPFSMYNDMQEQSFHQSLHAVNSFLNNNNSLNEENFSFNNNNNNMHSFVDHSLPNSAKINNYMQHQNSFQDPTTFIDDLINNDNTNNNNNIPMENTINGTFVNSNNNINTGNNFSIKDIEDNNPLISSLDPDISNILHDALHQSGLSLLSDNDLLINTNNNNNNIISNPIQNNPLVALDDTNINDNINRTNSFNNNAHMESLMVMNNDNTPINSLPIHHINNHTPMHDSNNTPINSLPTNNNSISFNTSSNEALLQNLTNPTSINSSSLNSPYIQTSTNTPSYDPLNASWDDKNSLASTIKSNMTEEQKKQKRKEFHNAVERRRRELIKLKISHLSKIIPQNLLSTDINGKKVKPNKTTILAGTVKYITFLNDLIEIQKLQTKRLQEVTDSLPKK